MKTHKRYALTICLLAALFFSFSRIMAQQEIPDNIKDHISKGIDAFGAAKNPADIETALKEFREAERIAPDVADVHYYLGKTYSLLQGNAGRARNELKKYLRLYPDAPEQDQVIAEIKRLDKVVEEKRLSSISGIEFIVLKDGIYVIKKLPVKTSSEPLDARLTAISVQPGDKLVSVGNTEINKNTTIDEVLSLICSNPKKVVLVKVIRGGIETNAVVSKVSFTNIENVTYLGEEDLQSIVEESPVPVIAVFWKVDDPECQKYVGDLKTEAEKLKDGIRFYIVNVDETMVFATEYNVTEVPALLFFKGGRLIGKITRYQPELFKQKAESVNTSSEPFGL